MYANLKSDSKEGQYVAQMKDAIEKIQELFTDALIDASENYQSANGQKSGSDNTDSKASRRDYWRPKLNQQEWNLLNREMDRQIESSKNILDPATKWLYANEKGVQVFAIYGVGDGTVPTPLYAVGNKKAQDAYQDIQDFVGGKTNGTYSNWSTIDRLLKSIRNEQRRSSNSIRNASRRSAEIGDVRVPEQEQASNLRTDNRTSSEDSSSGIKRSTRDPELQKANQLLEKENTQLREDVQELKELLKLQRQVTNGTRFTKTSVEAAARYLKSAVNAKGDTKEFAKLLNEFYEYIASGGEITWETVSDMAQPAIQWLREHQKQERNDYAQDILKQIRGTKVYLDQQQKQEAAHAYGSYNNFRKSLMGTITLSDSANMSLDSAWHKWSQEYPYLFKVAGKLAALMMAVAAAIAVGTMCVAITAGMTATLSGTPVMAVIPRVFWKICCVTPRATASAGQLRNAWMKCSN